MLYRKIEMELIVVEDEAEAVVAELNAALDRLEEGHAIFGGEIETVAVEQPEMQKRSALRHTIAAGETAANAIKAAGEKVAADLEAAGVDVILDDRDERAGVKFKDADLVGIPYRINIGRGVAEGKVELVDRLKLTNQEHPIDEIAPHLSNLIAQAKLNPTDRTTPNALSGLQPV